jgi:hypothetical protein
MKIHKYLIFFTLIFLAANQSYNAYAQSIPIDRPRTNTTLGNITNLEQLFIFIFNSLQYFGWAFVILGVAMAIFGLIYKLFGEDNEKVMATVQGYITKAIVIIIAGILLISSGFIVQVVGQLFGLELSFDFQQGLR